jgi:citrate lyase gamma subunit
MDLKQIVRERYGNQIRQAVLEVMDDIYKEIVR